MASSQPMRGIFRVLLLPLRAAILLPLRAAVLLPLRAAKWHRRAS
jgi:hypothetical protein